MKQIEVQQVVVQEITQAHIDAIKVVINNKWDAFYTAQELADHVEHGFIFGDYGSNEHYSKDFILQLINEVDLEKNPPLDPIVEVPILEEPVVTPEEPVI